MKQKKIEINQELVNEKARVISSLIDGMCLPDVFALMGAVVMNILLSCDGGSMSEVKHYVIVWLENLISQIKAINLDDTPADGMLN
jgi:hypothetical protein